MSIRVTPLANLKPSERDEWVRIVETSPLLGNPFLHPAFAEVADGTMNSVHVAIAADASGPKAFLPFEIDGRSAVPVAAGLNEQQALITEHTPLAGAKMLAEMQQSTLQFDHLIDEQAASLGVWKTRVGGSPQADLSNGFAAYANQRKAAGSSTIRETARKERKLAREHGPIEFEFHDDSDDVFERLVEWKQQQHVRTGVADLFSNERVVSFLRQMRLTEEASFRARMSVLRVAGRPLAVHLGLFTNRVGHVWYPAYDTSMGAYSPGLILLLKVMQSMGDLNIPTLDFGPGPQRYKQSLKTNERPICIGVVDQNVVVSALRKTVHHAKTIVKQSALKSLRQIAAVPLSFQHQAKPHA